MYFLMIKASQNSCLADIMKQLRINFQALCACCSAVACSFIFALTFLRNYFAEVLHRPSRKWRAFSSSWLSCYVVLRVALFMVTTTKQRSPSFHLKRCVLISFVYSSNLAIITDDHEYI